VLRPFAPSGAPSVLPRAPSVLPRCSPLLPLPSRNGKGSRAALEGAAREHRGSKEGSMGRCRARSRWEPELTALSRLQLPSILLEMVETGNGTVTPVVSNLRIDPALVNGYLPFAHFFPSFFIDMLYLLHSLVKYIYMPIYPRVLVYQDISSVLTMKMRMSSFQGNDSVAFVMTRASLDVALFSYISIASSSQRDKTVSLHHMIYIRDRR